MEVQERLYHFDGEVVSKETYLEKLGLTGYEDVYDEIQKKRSEKWCVTELYRIQLFDYNCVSCTSGVTEVFTDDIDEFSANYMVLEADEERKDRFLRSKNGEIVTDYYSDDPSLNIVTKVRIEKDLAKCMVVDKGITICAQNGYGYPSEYRFGVLIQEVWWVIIDGKYYKLARPSGRSCAYHSTYDEEYPWRKVEVWGNPFWIYSEKGEAVPGRSASFEDYKGTVLSSYVWQVVDIFDTEDEVKEDQNMLKEHRVLSDLQIIREFADLPGDAG